MLLLGAHISIAGGLHNAIEIALKLKCNCFQIFVKNQRQWQAAPLTDDEVNRWAESLRDAGDKIQHVVAHSGYLINLASDREEIRNFSRTALVDEMSRCRRLGIERLVLHPGNHRGQGVEKGIQLVAEGLNEAMAKTKDVTILLETTAGAGTAIGGNIEEIAEIIAASKYSQRLGCCLDTCHLFAAGYPLSPEEKINELIGKIDKTMGLAKVGCIHMNDSQGKLGSHLDRHEHIGQGEIGKDAFRSLVRHPALETIPKILETPKGSEGDALKYDRKNLACLKKLALSGA
jgi:deoxyribonuclease-4